jgi:hypothetical protein
VAYLIDASNLGGALGGRGGARKPEAVIAFLMGWARNRGAVTVVFDGEPDPRLAERYGPLEVKWSGRRSADDVIVAIAAAAPRRGLVITADRELARRCRDSGARVEDIEAFVERTGAAPPPARRRHAAEKPEPTAQDILHWRRVFGDPSKKD